MRRLVIVMIAAWLLLFGGVATASPLRVGSELVATRDVRLGEATLAKGSRVTVVAVADDKGHPVTVDLELKDGHVVRGVAYREVASAFRSAPR
jgi:hypothetical protein